MNESNLFPRGGFNVEMAVQRHRKPEEREAENARTGVYIQRRNGVHSGKHLSLLQH